MKNGMTALLLMLLSLFFVATAEAHTLRLSDGTYVTLEELINDLQGVRIVFVGELHDFPEHHLAQKTIIQGLHDRGAKVVVGLEMFRQDNQNELDRWVKGEIDEADFSKIFQKNWSMWPQYREIFVTARDEKIPMIGLNVDREITRQVAKAGFASLPSSRLQGLPVVRCDVDKAYMEFIRRILGDHDHGDGLFRNFCEAQLLWDSVMAKALVDYLEEHPDRTVVVLAGSGHSWKYGIPEQVRKFGATAMSFRVLLPQLLGRFDQGNARVEEADYLMIGLEEGPLH